MALFLIAATILQLPYHFSWYPLHRLLMIPSRLLLGWLQFPLKGFTTSLLLENREVGYITIAALMGFSLGLLVYFLWTHHWIGKILVGIAVLLQVSIGGFLSFWLGDVVRPPTEICQFVASDTLSLQIVGYGSQGQSHFDNYFVLATTDDGETWNQAIVQFYDIWDDNPPPPDCEGENLHYQELEDEGFIWLWTRENLGVSNDSGQSWYSWSPSCGLRERCDYGSIDTVTFDDSKNGHMNVVPLRNPPGLTTDLYSSDGGITWNSP